MSTFSTVWYGDCRNSQGTLGTDKLFTGQRLDDTGLYYYNARYYDAEIGRFISPDSLIPDPMNPQAFNRYSYVINNPLKYTDPTGHQYWEDYYYESLCEAEGIDPDAGVALFMGGGSEVVGTVEISTFAGWVDESPEPFDYISTSASPDLFGKAKKGMQQAAGIENSFYYHENLAADPTPLYYIDDEGAVPTLLGNNFGISIYPIGTFVKKSALPLDPGLPAHEGKHYSEQRTWGRWWYAAYGVEIAARSFIYWDTFQGYYHSSSERRARDWAGQPSLPHPIPW